MASVTVHLEKHRIALVHGQGPAVLRGHLKINTLMEETPFLVSCRVRFVGMEQADHRTRTLIDTVYEPPTVLPRTTFSLPLPSHLPASLWAPGTGGIRYNVIVTLQCGKEKTRTILPIEIYHTQPATLRSRLLWGTRKQWKYELETPSTIRLDRQPDEAITLRVRSSGLPWHYDLATCLVECCLSEVVRIGQSHSERPLLKVTHCLNSHLLSWRHHCQLLISHDALLTLEPRASTTSAWIQVEHRLRIALTFYDGHENTECVVHELPISLADLPDPTASLDDSCCSSDSASHDSAICLTCSPSTTTLSSCLK